MPSFKGEYEHSVDNKGRVAFPAKLRKNLAPEAQEKFTLLRGLEPCLYLYPQDEWERVEDKLSQINSFSRQGRTVKRNFLRFAEDLALDKQNRISLPSHLMDWSGIQESAIFIGSGERIEIWSPEKLDEVDSELSFESYQELFEKVMGGQHNGGEL
ncbi:division/cell wall cluster transcriptional repressor MraZ [Rhodohalobacter halophilus]|uniref:division/cell wall cluster transcriptional repressor MraZ n=1 Tax=Rhodohalobacter halophilus TaxID=1812810 RepID=UPI00083FC2E9|nr:division/cell wall cluster transcriptional repressor MraZ [Rhodohalobacter halophilus]